MAVIGSATLNIVPKVQGGLANAINREIKGANLSGMGKGAGSSFMGGFTNGASFGIWSQVASRAIDTVTASLGNAAGRVDTLNNYPRIMQSLGVETDVANRSISTMSDALQNVPTRLDDMANTVQGLYAATQRYGISLDTVTDAGLALNSMLLAGGQSQVIVNSAMEQFRQMVSKGKPELQDWKSLIQAAPGQLNQLAQEMLGATATADDLYAALGGGREADYTGPFEWGSLGMDEFIEKFAGMREQFEGAAEDAQGGIGTAFANMQNAVTKGVAGVLEAFGQENIAGAIGDVKGIINDVFAGVQDVAKDVAPSVMDAWESVVGGVRDTLATMGPIVDTASTALKGVAGAASMLAPAIPTITGIAGTFTLLNSASSGIGSVLGTAAKGLLDFAKTAGGGVMGAGLVSNSLFNIAYGAEAVSSVLMGPWGIAIAGATLGIGAYAMKHIEAKQKADEFQAALTSVSSVAESANGVLAVGARSVTDFGDAHVRAHADIDGLMQSMADYRDRVQSIQDGAAEQIGMLGQYKAVIDELAGAGEVSADKMALLQWALDGLAQVTGESYDAQQVLAGSYEDEAGAIHNLKSEIDDLIAKRQEDARQAALAEIYQETYKEQMQAARELSRAESEYYRAYNQWIEDYVAAGGDQARAAERSAEANKKLADNLNAAQNAYNTLKNESDEVAQLMTNAAAATGDVDNATFNWISTNQLAAQSLQDLNIDAAALSQALADAGISSEQLAEMGETSFMHLANVSNGSIDALIDNIQNYNGIPIAEKDGRVFIEDQELTDSLGNVFVWNGTELVSKDGRATVDDRRLTDAQGNVWVWNGTELVSKSATAEVDGDGSDGTATTNINDLNKAVGAMTSKTITAQVNGNAETAASGIWNTVSAIGSLTSKTVDVVTNTINNVITRVVGSSKTATGGHIEPRHASGYIAAGPTRTNWGWVGEDGVEAVYNNDDGSSDVYPLNNPRYLSYADPLADRIAKAIGEKAGGDTNISLNVSCKGDPNEVAAAIVNALNLVA